jgi:hypothetical protein
VGLTLDRAAAVVRSSTSFDEVHPAQLGVGFEEGIQKWVEDGDKFPSLVEMLFGSVDIGFNNKAIEQKMRPSL